jgi:predicted methyltransferase
MIRKSMILSSILPFLLLYSFAAGAAEPVADAQLRARLTELINSEERSEDARARNRYRNPLETLLFFGVNPAQTVVEIWPGGQGGWYRSILEPFFAHGRGRYIPVLDESAFPSPVAEVPDGSADLVLVFRAHGFMIYDQPAQAYYDTLFRMLKPGGVFGIVDHRGRESVPQDPRGEDGYVNQSHVMLLAQQAGFVLVESAEINANPLDTKDYPDGVYSLPPTLRGSLLNRGLRARMVEIGESDRMTLKFRKP